ncbi:MAG: FAD-dependent oxidoreductase [Gammaproteobacteria bacterium]|nr:FAD-dependent oxidoreductase [Gammaproteobacteria bacterium]
MKKIAIIGAGISGLTAARELQPKHDVIVFEKSRGRGGRTAHKRLEWGNFDIGAQYFTARSTEFKKQVDDWLQKGCVKEWEFTPLKLEQKAERAMLVASSDSTERYIGNPGMNSIAHDLSNNINIKFNVRVKTIVPTSNDCLELFDDKNNLLGSFDSVIIAVPAEQTIDLLPDDTSFRNSIPSSLHTPCWAVGIKTPKKVAPEIQGAFGDKTVSWVSRQSAKQYLFQSSPMQTDIDDNIEQDDFWMLHFSPEWSTKNLEATKPEVFAHAKSWFTRVFKVPVDEQNYLVHFWRYANLKDNTLSNIFWDNNLKIGAIGDWSSGGRIEGAFTSALNLINAENFKL